MFVWSIVSSVHGYVRKQKFSNTIRQHLWRGGLVLKRLAEYTTQNGNGMAASMPAALEAGWFQRFGSMRRRPSTPMVGGETGVTTIYRTNSLEVLYCLGSDGKVRIDPSDRRKWRQFGDSIGKLNLKSRHQTPVYFIASINTSDKRLNPGAPYGGQLEDYERLEDTCLPLCWRTDEQLQVLFACEEEKFIECMCAWSDRCLSYNGIFRIDQIETVDVTAEFNQHVVATFLDLPSVNNSSTGSRLSPANEPGKTGTGADSTEPGGTSFGSTTYMKILEDLCVNDILAVRNMCDRPDSQHCLGPGNYAESDLSSNPPFSPPPEINTIATYRVPYAQPTYERPQPVRSRSDFDILETVKPNAIGIPVNPRIKDMRPAAPHSILPQPVQAESMCTVITTAPFSRPSITLTNEISSGSIDLLPDLTNSGAPPGKSSNHTEPRSQTESSGYCDNKTDPSTSITLSHVLSNALVSQYEQDDSEVSELSARNRLKEKYLVDSTDLSTISSQVLNSPKRSYAVPKPSSNDVGLVDPSLSISSETTMIQDPTEPILCLADPESSSPTTVTPADTPSSVRSDPNYPSMTPITSPDSIEFDVETKVMTASVLPVVVSSQSPAKTTLALKIAEKAAVHQSWIARIDEIELIDDIEPLETTPETNILDEVLKEGITASSNPYYIPSYRLPIKSDSTATPDVTPPLPAKMNHNKGGHSIVVAQQSKAKVQLNASIPILVAPKAVYEPEKFSEEWVTDPITIDVRTSDETTPRLMSTSLPFEISPISPSYSQSLSKPHKTRQLMGRPYSVSPDSAVASTSEDGGRAHPQVGFGLTSDSEGEGSQTSANRHSRPTSHRVEPRRRSIYDSLERPFLRRERRGSGKSTASSASGDLFVPPPCTSSAPPASPNHYFNNASGAEMNIRGSFREGSFLKELVHRDDEPTSAYPGGGISSFASAGASPGSSRNSTLNRKGSTRSSRRTYSSKTMKPPNILIYTGADDGDNRLFTKLRNSLRTCLNTDKYTMYRLKHSDFAPKIVENKAGASKGDVATEPCVWCSHAVAVILTDTTALNDRHWAELYRYFQQRDGKLLFICQNKLLAYIKDCSSAKKRLGILKHAFASERMTKELEKFLKHVSKKLKHPIVCEKFEVLRNDGRCEYFVSVVRNDQTPLLMYMQNSYKRAGALFTDVDVNTLMSGQHDLIKEALKRLDLDTNVSQMDGKLSPGYLLHATETRAQSILDRIGSPNKVVGPTMTVEFFQTPFYSAIALENYLPIYCSLNVPFFDKQTYFRELRTEWLGRTVLYIPTANSTMTVFERLMFSLPPMNGVVAIARHQIAGQGRRGNEWLSPSGCAMLTFSHQFTLNSELGKAMGFLQHLVGLAVVHGIRSQPEYESLNLRLKWPNDIYYGHQTKLGGVLVTSSLHRNDIFAVIGVGLNVANSQPTVCINDLLTDDRPEMTPEAVIAWTLTQVEMLLDLYERGGPSVIMPLYYRYWLHSNQEVTLYTEEVNDRKSGERAVIESLDQHGYLQAKLVSTGEVVSVQPDGNSFDMMHNLIKIK